MSEQLYLTAIIPESYDGWRLDRALAEMFSDYSRSSLKSWILNGKVQIDQKRIRPTITVYGGEQVEIWVEPEQKIEWKAQNIPLNIVHEDEDLIVINKPANLVVHPGAGNPDGTLVNALLYYDQKLENLPRAGIVHRLDKDTTGIMVVARSLRAHTSLVDQLQTRTLKREYQAIVNGVVQSNGSIDAPIGRHPTQRVRMAVVENGKPAKTHYRCESKFPAHTHLKVQLESGRTHQIRVHMSHINFPIVGDPVYGSRSKVYKELEKDLVEVLSNFKRQALHSTQLTLEHPATKEVLSWKTPLPDDMKNLINKLKNQHTE
ncbi:MAG: 23S rRNA pseudouridine(1911/1915/1917) synthase RluD [Gammaproteobacteria bacterium]